MSSTPLKESSTDCGIKEQYDFAAFKSFYYLLKAKRDTNVKLFDEDKCFNYDDFIDLNSKVYRKLENHIVFTHMVNVTIGLEDKEVIFFGNWIEFTRTDWQIASKVKYIIIDWIFQLRLPNIEIPQEHTLRIKVGNSLNPNEFINIMLLNGGDVDIEEIQSQMCCKIDYVNSQICSELLGIVTEWYKALPTNGNQGMHKIYKTTVKYEDYILNTIKLSIILAGIFFIYCTSTFIEQYFTQNDIFRITTIALSYTSFILYLSHIIGAHFAKHTYKKIGKLRREPMICITKGDKNATQENIAVNNKLIRAIIFNLIAALTANAIGYILAYIIDFAKK